MRKDIHTIGMDTTLLEAANLCAEHRIRHLPVLDERGRLVGILTDRDLRLHISPRVGTISENNSDREILHRHVHVIMVRGVITGMAEMPLAEGARLLLDNRVGCLPIVDKEKRVLGIVTSSDFLRLVAESDAGRTTDN